MQLYLNGVYWGLYSLTEHPNASWAAENLGGDKDDYDVYDNEAALIDGNSTAWNTMFSMAGAGLSTASAYTRISAVPRYPVVYRLHDPEPVWRQPGLGRAQLVRGAALGERGGGD